MSTRSEILHALLDKRNVLAMAPGLETALVMDSSSAVKARCTSIFAEGLVREGLVSLRRSGKLDQYALTDKGREAIQRERVQPVREAEERNHLRVNLGDSPLDMLRRRKDKSGQPFLRTDEIESAHRIELDFVSAGFPATALGVSVDDFLSRGTEGCTDPAAGKRTHAAMRHLGDGLSDIVLRVVCLHEGLENAEKRLGWATRSGKIVLRIALQHLTIHYGEKT